MEKFKKHGWPEFFVAHNAEYDRSILLNEMKRNKEALLQVLSYEDLNKLFTALFLCSIQDIEYKIRAKCRVLSHLALEHKVKMDGRNLHCAIDDVFLLMDMLLAAQIDWDLVCEAAKIPWVIVRAMIPKPFGAKGDGGAGKDKAKACGYRYGELGEFKLKETWLKKIKIKDIEAEQEALGYKVSVVYQFPA